MEDNNNKPKYDALTIAKYLLSLDKEKKYFVTKKMENKTTLAVAIRGNFRLNQMLYLLQISYYQKYKQLLFEDKLYAWEHGVIVYSVYTHFWSLYYGLNGQNLIEDEETKEFITKHFNHLKDISDRELQEFSYTDPVWSSTWKQSSQPEINFTNKENQEIYQHFCPRWLQEVGL